LTSKEVDWGDIARDRLRSRGAMDLEVARLVMDCGVKKVHGLDVWSTGEGCGINVCRTDFKNKKE
jgi:hypothetical protein